MNGSFDAFDAATGEKLWSQNLGIGVCTPPITYRVKGIQYVAVGAAGCAHSGGPIKDTSKSRFGDTIAIYALILNAKWRLDCSNAARPGPADRCGLA